MTNDEGRNPMSKVESSRGMRWVGQALGLVRRWPQVFLPMGLIVGAIYLIPLLGGLVLLILGPSLLAGAVIAARDADRGDRPAIGQLFELFREEGRLSQGLRLCLPMVGGQVLAGFLIGIPVARAMMQAGIDIKALESQPEMILGIMGGSLFVWALVALLVVLFAYAFTATAIARVALDRREAMAAMAESLRLVRANLGAWVVTALLLFAGMFVLAMFSRVLGVPTLVQALCYAALYTVLGPLLYFAWRDLCAGAQAGGPPPSPPPVLEA
jgi:hypothetical protein